MPSFHDNRSLHMVIMESNLHSIEASVNTYRASSSTDGKTLVIGSSQNSSVLLAITLKVCNVEANSFTMEWVNSAACDGWLLSNVSFEVDSGNGKWDATHYRLERIK